jgi:GT2 family glycosyltransferase/glycosyltransferase involved in cell wall biosynthesis
MRVLHAIHDFLPRHQAGSEIYVLDLARAQQELGVDARVLCAEYDLALTHGTFRWRVCEGVPVIELINNWAFSTFEETYRSPLLRRQLTHILHALRPHVLHVHNFLNLTFELPAIARQLGVPTVATLHEYVLVCPSGGQRLHEAEQHVCTVIDPNRCSRCFAQHAFGSMFAFGRMTSTRGSVSRIARVASNLRRRVPGIAGVAARAIRHAPLNRPGVTADDITRRLAAARKLFDDVELFVAPSPHLGAEFERLGVPREKLVVRDYGFPSMPRTERSASSRLRIGFVGTLVWHKGVHVLIEAARALPKHRIELLVFGDTGTFPEYVGTLREQARGLDVRFMGRFDRASMPAVYAQVDVLVVPSLWLENSPLVIHEAFMSRVPVVASRTGGTQDLIADGVNGLLYDARSPAELTRALQRLLDDPLLLPKLAAAAPAVRSIEDDASEWRQIYGEVVRKPVGRGTATNNVSAHTCHLSPPTDAVVLNHRTPDDTVLAIDYLRTSDAPLRTCWVVDNGSQDGRLEFLRRGIGDARLIESGQNLGFSGGANLGIRAALARGAERVLLLNNDAVLPPDSLEAMHEALDRDPGLGIVGGTIVSRADPDLIVSQGIRFSTRTGRMRHIGFGRRIGTTVWDAVPVRGVDAVSGCAMLVRREVFDRVGLLDECYFFSFEDIDFCLRARTAGFRTACAVRATVLHAGSASIGPRSPRLIYFGIRNHLLLGSRLPGVRWLRQLSIAALNLVHVLISSPVPRRRGIFAMVLGVHDYLRGRLGPDPETRARTANASGGPAVAPTEPA